METARERIYRLLLTHPKQSWMQKDLAARAGCSRGHASRVVEALTVMGVLARPFKNRVVLTGPAKLLTLWASQRRLPPPTYVETARTQEELEAEIEGSPGTGLTLFRAAWHRTKFMATSTVEIYAPRTAIAALANRLGSPAAEPTTVSLYPTEGPELEGIERVGSVPLVSVPQNVVDLMAVGGQGPRVAIHLARVYGFWET
ncbi:MAG TPA: hypothetical protein VIL45_05065 [Thermoplasmata archaeon]